MKMDNSKILAISLLIFLQVSVILVFAQNGGSDPLMSVLTALLGRLPEACASGIGASSCLECISISKFLPMVLFISIFYFAFYYILKHISPWTEVPDPKNPGQRIPKPMISPTETKIAVVVSIVIGLFLLHTPQIQGGILQVELWARILIAFIFIMIIGRIGHISGGGLLWIIIAVLFLLFAYPSLSSYIKSVGVYYQATCVGY